MSDRQAFTKLNDVFSEDDRESIYAFLSAPGWETGWKSNSKRDAYSFLHKHFAGHRKSGDPAYDCESELLLAAPPIWMAWLKLKEKWFANETLARCYANGMMYGCDGTVHTDANEPGSWTLIYYPHARWSPNWGGETIFYTKAEDGIVGCVYPRPNSAILFDGRIPHRANGVTRQYPGLRITLMFKIERINGQ